MANISDKLKQIRQAIFGKEVRESIASGIEAMNNETENTTNRQRTLEGRQNNLDNKFDEQIKNMTLKDPSSAEIVAMRTDKNGVTHPLAGKRIDNIESQMDDIAACEIVADIDSTSFKAGRKVDIETLRQTQNKNFFTFMKKIRNREPLKIVCQGDSLTYGSDITSTDRRPASDVVNSDGSKSGVSRGSTTYPEALEKYLNQVYRSTVNPQLINVETRAYPGDWTPKSFNRHFKKHTCDLTIIMLGTNDSRRADYQDAGNIDVYYYWLEQLIVRELLWDKAVLLLTPPKTLDLNLDVDAFANAVHGLGNKYNIPVIDSDEFTSQYPASIYSDATHFNGTGYSIFGSRVASLLVGEGAHKPKQILGGSVLLTRRTLDNASLVWNASYSGSTSAYAPGPNELDSSQSMNLFLTAEGGEMIYSFYAMNENLIVIPNMFVSSNAVVNVELDFGVPQAQNSLDSVLSVYSIEETVPNKLDITYPSSKWINKKHYLDNSLEPLRITQKGWHTIRIKTTVASVSIYGLEFLSFQEWDNVLNKVNIGFNEYNSQVLNTNEALKFTTGTENSFIREKNNIVTLNFDVNKGETGNNISIEGGKAVFKIPMSISPKGNVYFSTLLHKDIGSGLTDDRKIDYGVIQTNGTVTCYDSHGFKAVKRIGSAGTVSYITSNS